MKQITVICKGCKNPVQEITGLLGNNGVDIRDIGFQQFDEDAVLNLVADDFEKAMSLLSSQQYTLLTDETLLIKVEDKLGMLAEISKKITDAGVSIRSLALMKISKGDNVVTISTNNNARVREIYKNQLVN
ncbi:MAG: hypothetical protein AAF434_09720 [Pseudomonadota bacterium]